jgi:cytochrome b561
MTTEKYHASIRVIHWIMFVLFVIMFVLGFVMVEFKESEPWALYNFHKSTGVLLFGLVLIRLMLRWVTTIPPHSSEIKPAEHRIATIAIYLLYLLMIIVPITGYALSNLHGYHVEFYGWQQLPDLFSENEEWGEVSELVHEYAAYAFLAVIGLHLLGVIKHHVKGQDVLSRVT